MTQCSPLHKLPFLGLKCCHYWSCIYLVLHWYTNFSIPQHYSQLVYSARFFLQGCSVIGCLAAKQPIPRLLASPASLCVCVLNAQWNHRLFCPFLGISLLLSYGEVLALMADEPFRAHKHKWDSGEFNGWHPRAPSPLPVDAVSGQRMPICVTNTSTRPDKTPALTDTLTTGP